MLWLCVEILQMVYSQIWGHDETIYFYFDNNNVVIYPETRGGFDKVYARIHIADVYKDNGIGFFYSYTVKSMKEKNSVLIKPLKLASFIEDLKVLVDLSNDATFKLIQSADNEEGIKKQYIEITGQSKEFVGSNFKTYVEVSTIFQADLYPEELQPKEVSF